tara:strand:- start:537 stop:758 length:222 start_codon:yes stop_codon:yes gene_type:complete
MFQVSAMAAYFKAISILVKGLQGKNWSEQHLLEFRSLFATRRDTLSAVEALRMERAFAIEYLMDQRRKNVLRD